MIRTVFYPREFVYDCTTETGTLVVSGIRHHNTGGVYGATNKRENLFKTVQSLLDLPKNMPGKAVLTRAGGKIQSIDKNKAKGGFDVDVAGQRYYVPSSRAMLQGVVVGSEMKIGDALSDGIKDPRELATLVGFPNAQEYLAGAIRDAFAAGGQPMPRKHFETVVRSASANVEVLTDPTGDYMPGQIVNYANIDSRNQQRAKQMEVTGAVGSLLSDRVKGFEHLYGRVLTADDVKSMKKSRVRTVKATPDPITFMPKFHGIQQVPQRRENWVAQLAYRGLEPAIRRGAAEGWTSNLHGIHPIPGLVFGKELKIKQPEIEAAQGAY